jgi:para-nitrobenzyl esterase
VIIETRYGKLRGVEERGVYVFRGIPYARPPVGMLRFRPPERPEPWTGVRDARDFGPAAPQHSSTLGPILNLGIGRTSEDCLFLNVWTPGPGGSPRPVLVWIHGGAFVIGAGSQTLYDGATLARRGDVVVVTINYRLGGLGFLRLKELSGGKIPATGNEGLLDQLAALDWVHDEIGAFGGDRGNVTIFGESAGAMSCATLLGTPCATGLFHRAILQSGSANYVASRETATGVAEALLREIDLTHAEVEAVSDVPPQRIVAGQGRLFGRLNAPAQAVYSGKFLAPGRIGLTIVLRLAMIHRLLRRLTSFALGTLADLARPRHRRRRGRFRSLLGSLFTKPQVRGLPFEPVLDGDLLPRHPFDAVADGLSRRVPLLLGTNLDEAKLFMFMDPRSRTLDERRLVARCEENIPGADRWGVSRGRRAIEVYREARAARGESTTLPELWYAIESDRTMRYPAMRLAEFQSAHQAQTYAYLFTWPSPVLGGMLGSCHALELPFVFGTLNRPFVREFAGSYRPGARELAERIQDAWINFARTGNPAHRDIGPWPAYDAKHRATMVLDRECHVVDAPREPERAFWEFWDGTF